MVSASCGNRAKRSLMRRRSSGNAKATDATAESSAAAMLFDDLALDVAQIAVHLNVPKPVVAQAQFEADHGLCFPQRIIPLVDVAVFVVNQGLVDGQRNKTAAQSSGDRSEAGGCDLLEDRHHESQRHALAALPLCEGEAILQIFVEALVEKPFAVAHQERFGVDPTASEQGRAIGAACIRLGAPDHHRIEPVALLDHLLRGVEQGRIQKLDHHPEAEVIALVGRR